MKNKRKRSSSDSEFIIYAFLKSNEEHSFKRFLYSSVSCGRINSGICLDNQTISSIEVSTISNSIILKKTNILKYSLFILFGLYLMMHLFVYTFQKSLLFQGTNLPQNHEFHFTLPHQEFFLDTKDGEKINAVLIKTEKKRQGVVLYFHGNNDNIDRWAKYHEDLTARGYDFFAIDYRSYGKSTGEPSCENFYADAALAYDFITKSISPDSLIIYGRSLGTGVASQLAAQKKAKLLILETPYSNIKTVIANRLIPLFLPFELKYPFENIHTLPKVPYPTLLIHGTKDKVISYECAKELLPILEEKDTFVTIKNGGHRDLSEFEDFQKALNEYLGKK